MKTLPNRLPDFYSEYKLSRSNAWFEEMVIQRDTAYMYAEELMVGTDGQLYFVDAETGEQSHLVIAYMQEAYKKWLDKKIEKVLLG